MALINYHRKCRVCGHDTFDTVLDLGEHYLHGLFVVPTFEPPTRKIPTELVRCDSESGGCGLVQLSNSVDPDILYSKYGYRSSTNATMRGHLKFIAHDTAHLFEQKNPNSLIISCLDIGCNDGFLSKQYPASYYKVGIDPCDIGNTITGIERFTFINDLFPSKKLNSQFNIITMIACFYDVNNPIEVAHQLFTQTAKNGIVVVEVSYWPDKMKQDAIDEVCHEHVCFYNYQNLEYIFTQAGFKVFDARINNINGGSIQLWMSRNDCSVDYSSPMGKSNIQAIKFSEIDMALDTQVPYNEFADRCIDMRREVMDLVRGLHQQDKKIHLYGASTKGNVLLQFLGIDSEIIPYAAERSKEKWGGSTLGTGIKMISEEASRAMNPDYYFVPIWSFKDEIIAREQEFLTKGGKLIFPLPKLEIIGK